MNNRYLYRAKRCDNGEWIVGFYHWTNWRNPQTKEIVEVTHSILPIDYQDSYHVDSSTICQCTGLKDKNGKLIWENDIVKISGHIYVCYWDEYNFEWGLKSKTETVGLGYIDKCIIEVIGNKFDNPELLEV